MEKKLILVGMRGRREAVSFMCMVLASLKASSVDIVYCNNIRVWFETKHTKVRFIFPVADRIDCLVGIRADAIFGQAFTELLMCAKNDAVIADRDGIGLVDYICRVEREASVDSIGDITKKAFYELFEKYIRLHNIPAQFHRDYENGREYRLIIQHQYKPNTAVHILWDEVEDVDKIYDAVIGELKKWPCGFRGTVAIDEMSAYPCDISREQIYISTAGTDYNPFYKLFTNSVYGASFNNQMVYASGRGNGKSTLSAERISKMIAEEADFTVQQQLYAALVKGEINMPTKKEEFVSYCRSDVASTAALYAAMRDVSTRKDRSKLPAIKTVHFSGPVTAVIWEDGTKTTVRCKDGEVPDYEKGFAMAIAKKAMGTNKSGSNYYDVFKKHLPKPEEE